MRWFIIKNETKLTHGCVGLVNHDTSYSYCIVPYHTPFSAISESSWNFGLRTTKKEYR